MTIPTSNKVSKTKKLKEGCSQGIIKRIEFFLGHIAWLYEHDKFLQ